MTQAEYVTVKEAFNWFYKCFSTTQESKEGKERLKDENKGIMKAEEGTDG